MEENGVEVRVLTQDASTLTDATKLLKTAAQSGPVGGIFHLAVVSCFCHFSIIFLQDCSINLSQVLMLLISCWLGFHTF